MTQSKPDNNTALREPIRECLLGLLTSVVPKNGLKFSNEELLKKFIEMSEDQLLAIFQEHSTARVVEELDNIDKAYEYGSIVTHQGFKKYKARRIRELESNTKEGGE